MAWIALSLRRIRDDRAAVAGLALLVLVTALIASLAPRVIAGLADDAVRAQLRVAPAAARDIALEQHLLIGSGPADDPLSFVRAAGLEREQTFPAAVRRLIASRSATIQTGRLHLDKETTDPAFIRLRLQEGVDQYVSYVQGRAPTPKVDTRDGVGAPPVDGVQVYEVGVSEDTARAFGLAVGDTVELDGDNGDPLVGRGTGPLVALATITGIY